MRARERVWGVAALFTVACGGAGNEHAGAKNGGRATGLADPSASTPEIAVAPVPLRRLTREEYDNSVRDLLGDKTHPAEAFPPDESLGGFETNSVAPVSEVLVQRYMDAAEALAETAVKHIATLAPCAAAEPHDKCAQRFIDTFGRRAFRRPLEDGERAALLGVFAAKEKRSSYAGGIQLTLETILESPQFLYRIEASDGAGSQTRALNGYELATRLAFFVWASTPDDELLDDAAAGRLSSPDDVARAARRLLKDPRAIEGIRSFHRQWLGLREIETASRDAALARIFTPELKRSMVEETLRLSEHAVFSGGDSVAALLTWNKGFVDAPLAALYGVPTPRDGSGWVDLPARERSGLLSQASVMTLLANGNQTSPVLRGKFVREKLLCDAIPPPPPNVVTTPPKVDPKLTTKERFAQHRTDPSCASCHQEMDPIGFGFEHYDAIGGWRKVDGAFPVDAVGEVAHLDGADVAFDGAVELGAKLSASQDVRRCVATQWFRYAIGRSERDSDVASIGPAYETFARGGFDIRELVVAITRTDAFRYVQFEEGASR